METENSKQERCRFCQCLIDRTEVCSCFGSRLCRLATKSVPSEVAERFPVIFTSLKACKVKMR